MSALRLYYGSRYKSAGGKGGVAFELGMTVPTEDWKYDVTTVTGSGSNISASTTTVSSDFFAVDGSMLLGMHPVEEAFVYLRGGLTWWTASASGGYAYAIEDGVDLHYGLGAGYQFTDSFEMRADYTRAHDSYDFASASLIWRF